MANRTIAIGDIHGCADALQALLHVIQPDASDTIITLGDYVDRGPNSALALDILIDLISHCNLVPLLGNHEIMMTAAMKSRRDFEFWLFNGGKSTLHNYGGDLNNVPMHHRTFLNHCRRSYETDTHIFVHAAYNHAIPLNQQPDELLFWQHVDENFVPLPHESGKIVVCGHTPQVNGEVRDLGHILLLDTFCYGDKWLTAMNIETGETLQATADGLLREPHSDLSGYVPSTKSLISTPGVDLTAGDEWLFNESRPSSLEHQEREFEEVLSQIGERIAQHLQQLDDYPVLNIDADDPPSIEYERLPRGAGELSPILDDLFTRHIPASFNTASPGYLAYIPGGGIPDAAMADLIASTTNRFVTVWNASPVMAQIESTVIRWFCELMGLGTESGGFLTTGGSLANLSALIVARVKLAGDDFHRARIYASSQTHHCIDKAAFMAGFPKDNLRKVPVDEHFGIDVSQLAKTIDDDRNAGYQPLMIIGNAGTTNTGAVDDLQQLADLAQRESCWFHVDAAYGGFFMLTTQGRSALSGIELADSIVLDPHKGMFLPYGTGCLLVKNRSDLLPAFQFTSEYMPQMTGDRMREDFCEISPELSRDNRGLRLWLPIKLHGIGVWEELLTEKLQLAHWAYERLLELGHVIAAQHEQCELQIVAPPQLSILAFRMEMANQDVDQNNEFNRRWLDAINQDGSVMMTGTLLDGRFVLRICVLSFRTHIERMQKCLSVVCDSAVQMIEQVAV